MTRRLFFSKTLIRAYLTFFVCIVVLYTLLRTSVMRELIGQPLAMAFTVVSGLVLNLLSLKATASGTLLQVEGFAARIDDVCTGIFVVAIFVSAVMAYPSRMKEKLKGFLLGASVIFSLNLIRVVSLMYIGRYFPTFFETAHLLIWQSLVIFAALLAWLYWTERFVGAPQH
ncbi:membrane protein [Candidatus Methylomirabilis lanthanidiphila]|uniref:Membrane protein n=1 Tax=Candidatus Methylomirabilis lanthanidiphila TaxID=2211376 RepID=A0A564ZLE5_9BACT|nr:exosortase H [Candidatus Methylomirabilis lanthanidiphila]VUZ85687.1 membrane protein [Candidatus Methylomirabilis lanthanidiphila]